MSEKVKLTKEQAEAIEYIRENSIDANMNLQINGGWDDKRSVLGSLSLDEFIRALYIGYEVEETFEVGDTVVLNSGKVVEILEHGWGPNAVVVGWIINRSMYKDMIDKMIINRHATKQEKWWAKHGRKPLELKINDVLLRSDEAYVSVFHVDESQEQYRLVVQGAHQHGYEVDKE